ncbi:sigma-70 family RNA polymerase sigma factor [Halobacillus mangrovi]|uniref:sigma-70 family RNA polymerase sigma factor n=1 Tax=Halobacillus mangrovi TaxID=402384 RepID=UPI003D96714F
MNRLTVLKTKSNHKLPENWWENLQRYGLFLSKNKWDGEDLAQEAIVKALLKYPQDEWSLALLKKVTYHTWVDQVRKREKEELHESVSESKTNTDSPSNEEVLDQLLTQLTAKQAVTFFLKEVFLYKSRELADYLGMSEEAVKDTLHRARRRLQSEGIRSIQPMDEEDYEVLYPLFRNALITNDPSRLLKMAPLLKGFTSTRSLSKKQSFSPMCVAA